MDGMRYSCGWPSVWNADRQRLAKSKAKSVLAAFRRLFGYPGRCRPIDRRGCYLSTWRADRPRHVIAVVELIGKDTDARLLLECDANTKLFAPNDVTLQPQSILLHNEREVRRNMD